MKLEFLDFDFSDAKKNSNMMPQGINTNIDITNAEFQKNILNLNFVYTASYIPDGSYVRIGGKATLSGPEMKPAYDEWVKSKKISGLTGEQIVNLINYSASINAIFIARVFNLTPPIAPPVIKFETGVKPKK